MLNFKNSKGWTKFLQLFGILFILSCIITIGQIFFAKDLTVTDVFNNVMTGKYSLIQYVCYGVYVFSKLIVLLLVPMGADIINRLIGFKHTMKSTWKRKGFNLLISIVVWLTIIIIGFEWKTYFEDTFFNAPSLTKPERFIQLLEYVFPAITIAALSNSFTEISIASKIKNRTKLPPEVEDQLIEILRGVTLTPNEEKHLIRNFKIQVNKYSKHKK